MTNVRVNPEFDETFCKIGLGAMDMFGSSASNGVRARNVDDDLEELDDEIESRDEIDEEDEEEDVLGEEEEE